MTRAENKSPEHHFNPQEGESKKIDLKLNSLNTVEGMDDPIKEREVISSVPPQFETSHLPPDFEPKKIQLFLIVQFCANLLINFDMGILPAGSVKIKQELKLDNTWFGFLGSVVYAG